jgi:hypothetical protein
MVSIKSVNVAMNKRIRSWGLDRNVLHNKYVLYVTVVLVIVNMVGTVIMGDVTTPLIFVIVGFLTTFFSKNMFVVLTMGLVVANVLKYGATMGYADTLSEGFEDATHTETSTDAESHEIVDTEQYLEKDGSKDESKKESKKESMSNESIGGSAAVANASNAGETTKESRRSFDTDGKIKSTSKKMESMANQYKKLEGLQNQIISGMDQVTSSLTHAEKIMKDMKQHV